MATIVFTKLQAELAKLGIDTSQQAGSNVKKAFTGGKSTSTKPGLLAAERDTGGNFATVLDTFKNDAKYIGTMNDVEQMAFLNNIMDYNEFGGKSIRTSEGIRALDEAKNLTDESSDLKTAIDNLTNKAKSMKDEAELNVNKAYKDLDDFFETGGDPFKKKDDKFLGGSMAEEGQIRTGIRQFLQKELKNGRINLDKKDTARVLKYFPTIEDDPILVFKKIYGDEAYNKAGTFPGAFDIGENYNQYEEIFRKNMGTDSLKVKDKKYVGDGKLLLTESEEVFTPSKFDDDIPYAEGGRASFAGGKVIDEIIVMLVKKEPMEAMKEVNKIIGKKGKYKNLTQKDIDRIVDQTNDHIFQRDPDNLFVEDRPMFKKETDEVDLSQGMIDLDELNFTSNAKAAKEAIDNTSDADLLMKKYPGMGKELAEQIATDTNPKRKADVIAMVEQTFELNKQGKSGDEIIDIFKKNTDRTKQADGGITQLRNGYYGGGQAMVGEDLSQIGHGSDSLMARNMQLSPNSMATTSTGLNYLLGEDNDTVRVPYNEGNMVLPKPKPAQNPLVELSKIYKTYEDAMPGVSKDTQKYLQQDFIQKLNDAKISQEEFMTYRMQNSYPEGRADGGRIGFAGGGKDASTTSFSKSYDSYSPGSNTASRANKTVDAQQTAGQRDADRTNDRISNTKLGIKQDLNNYRAINNPKPSTFENIFNTAQEFNYLRNLKNLDPYGLGISYGLKKYAPGAMKKLKGLFSKAELEEDQNGIMQMAELNDMQKKMLSGPQKQLKDIMGISNEEILQNISPFNTEETPATIDDVNKFYAADGGIAGLRKGYAGGKGVDLARRGFLKILGGSVAAATAFKTGLVKLLGKESGAVSKKAVDEFFASSASGAPTWFEPLVNKALKEGLDITEKAAIKDGQIVKQLDTPTGKVDVTYDTRTGAVDVDYMGGDTAMGEGLQMRYAPGDIIEEGAKKGQKSDDVFEAVESIPEFQGGNYMDGPDLGFGENMTSNIDDLYSDTSELATLGGEKLLVKDISNTLKKKKILKEMDNNPQEFAQDMSPDTYYED